MASGAWVALSSAELNINSIYKVQQINPPSGFRRGAEYADLRYLGKERGYNPDDNEMEAFIFRNTSNGSTVPILDNVKHLYEVQLVRQSGGARKRRQTRNKRRQTRRKQSRRYRR